LRRKTKDITDGEGLTAGGRRLATTIGQNVKIARIQEDLTQAQLASLCGVEQAAISMIEKGKRGVTLNMLAKLAKALNKREHVLLKPIKL
jgi:Helix-turn-helix.